MSVSLAIDIGNTRVKGAFFREGTPGTPFVCAHVEVAEQLRTELKAAAMPAFAGISGVAAPAVTETVMQVLQEAGCRHVHVVGTGSRLPVGNAYATPKTLGTDRICLAVGAWAASGGGPVLVADAGTALTFDFVDAAPAYRGGSIAPGLQMRFRALHEMTARLPRVELPEGDEIALVGDSTEASIRSGVILGMAAEIDGVAARYRAEFGSDLPFYITGGDSVVLLNHLKSINFVDFNILLKGIHAITHHHFEHA